MLNCIIFSKNRPMQLELTIRTIREKFKQIKRIHVLYKYTNSEYERGYNKLFGMVSDVVWFPEIDFRQDLLTIATWIPEIYTVCFSDDSVMINDCDVTDIIKEIDKKTVCVSLKLSSNVEYSYCQGHEIKLPDFIEIKPYLRWSWSKENFKSDWGYPHALCGHIYRTNYLRALWQYLIYCNPNTLEGQMNIYRPVDMKEIVAFLEQKMIGIENNRVQDVCPNRHGSINTDYLNTLFLRGYVIDTSNIYGVKLNAQQTELEFKYCLIQ